MAGCGVPASAPFPHVFIQLLVECGYCWVLGAVKPSAASDKCYFKSYVETVGDALNLTFSNDA